MLDQFPKQRQALPEDYASIYLTLYSENRSGNSVLARVRKYLESWMHRQLSTKNTGSENLLEVGAGQLNHANYETNYQTYDVIEPLIQDWDSEVLRKVTSIYSSIFEIEAEKRYDRIFSIAVLEHIADLPLLVAHSAHRIHEGGLFQAAIPCEGSWLWHLSSRTLVGAAFRLKYGLNYDVLMDYEHLNTYSEIVDVVSHFFRHVKVKRTLNLPFHLSLYAYIEATDPKLNEVYECLESRRS